MRASHFAQLKALAAIVEEGSFSRAAAQLQMSRSALSQVIRTLEDQLGVQLLNRTTRSVSPTEACTRLLARFVPAMTEMQDAIDEVRSSAKTPAGSLRIHTQRLGYEQFIRPIVGEFAAQYPEIVLDVAIDDAVVDIVGGGFDLGIRLGELLDQDMVAVKLGDPIRQIAVASPDYIRAHGAPTEPRDLLDHRCIGFRWPGQDAIYNWEFKGDDNWFSVAIKCSLIFNEQRATIEAATQGAGIAFWAESEVRPWIEANKLVPLLENWSPSFPGFYLYFPQHRQRSAAMQAFTAFLKSRWG